MKGLAFFSKIMSNHILHLFHHGSLKHLGAKLACLQAHFDTKHDKWGVELPSSRNLVSNKRVLLLKWQQLVSFCWLWLKKVIQHIGKHISEKCGWHQIEVSIYFNTNINATLSYTNSLFNATYIAVSVKQFAYFFVHLNKKQIKKTLQSLGWVGKNLKSIWRFIRIHLCLQGLWANSTGICLRRTTDLPDAFRMAFDVMHLVKPSQSRPQWMCNIKKPLLCLLTSDRNTVIGWIL